MSVNQAVVFTKPVHHLKGGLTPALLDERARSFFTERGFNIVFSKKVTGVELADRNVIRQHYLMYSKAACAETIADLNVLDAGKKSFEDAFRKNWDDEVAHGRIMTTAKLLKSKGIDVHQLFELWNAEFAQRKTAKIQDGLLMAFLAKQDAYCINAFYPAMEANFYNPETQLTYYVLDFDPRQTTWEQFRKKILGATDSSKADPESFRGRLYSEYNVEFPGRDNFVHGSAGPLEGFVERSIHEADFDACDNPVGRYLAERDISREDFESWKLSQSVSQLGELFDATEEKNTGDVISLLDAVDF